MVPASRCLLCGSSADRSCPAVLAPFVAERTAAAPPEGFALLACDACDFAWFSHRFDDRENARLYDGYRGAAYTAARRRWEPTYGDQPAKLGDETAPIRQSRIDRTRAVCTPVVPCPARVLDYGGGSEPWLARGMFPAAAVALHDLAGGLLDEPAPFDLVVASQVLEHVADPLATLADAARFVAPGGWLYVDIPIGPSSLAALLARSEPAVCHEHVSYFTPRSLRIALVRAGFAVAPRSTHGAAIGRKVQSPVAARALQQFAGTRVERWRGSSEAQRFE